MDDSAGAPAGMCASPAEVAALVDRIAGTDAMDASKAWLELGARYRDSRSYIGGVCAGFWDTRPVAFEIVKERMSGGGATFIYYTVKTPGTKGVPAFVHTVGQALAYHLWQYEDASNSGFKGTFRAWWSGYAGPHGLPGPR